MAHNGKDLFDDIMKRVDDMTKTAEKNVPRKVVHLPGDPLKLADMLDREAVLILGDVNSDDTRLHTTRNDGEGYPKYNHEQVIESQSGPHLSKNVKEAALNSGIVVVSEEIADNMGQIKIAAAKWVMPAAIAAGTGFAGYAAGRVHGKHIDRRDNAAFYRAGAYHGAQALARELMRRKKKHQAGGGK